MKPERTFLIGLALLSCAACSRPRPERYRVADTAGNELLRLDEELCVLGRWSVPSPRDLAPSPAGTWIAYAGSSAAELPQRLGLFDGDGRPRVELAFQGVLDLCPEERGAVLVVDRTAPRARRLWRVDEHARRILLGEFPGACAVAARPDALLLACTSGELLLLRADGAILAGGAWPDPVRMLARGPGDTWWVLGGSGEALLGLTDRTLEPRWRVATGLATGRCAAVTGEERAWLADAQRVRRYGPGGALEVELVLDGGGTPRAAEAATRSACLVSSVGALLAVEALGTSARVRRAQGGFAALGPAVGVGEWGMGRAVRARAGRTQGE